MNRRVATVLVVLSIVGSYWYGHHRGLQAIAFDTHEALCALRTDIATRQQTTKEFLADVKAGRRDPVPGISNADFRRSIDNQQHTLDALEPLRCD